MEYFNKPDYDRAMPLLEELLGLTRGDTLFEPVKLDEDVALLMRFSFAHPPANGGSSAISSLPFSATFPFVIFRSTANA